LINTYVRGEPLDEDLCGTHRVDLERQHKEKTMGRPINKRYIGDAGAGETKISVTRYRFTGGSETASSSTQAHIVSQKSPTRFNVTDGTDTEVLTLVNKANGALAEGEMKIVVTLDDSTTAEVTKLYNRTAQIEGGTASVDRIVWSISTEPETDSNVPNRNVTGVIDNFSG